MSFIPFSTFDITSCINEYPFKLHSPPAKICPLFSEAAFLSI
jgi:hypothetical protein